MIKKLAIPFNGISEVEISNPSPPAIAKARSEALNGKYPAAVLEIIKDSVSFDGKPLESLVRKMPWRSAEGLAKEIFTETSNLPRYYEGSSVCEICEFENIHKKRETEDDDRIDLTSIENLTMEENRGETFIIDVPKDEVLRNEISGSKYGFESEIEYEERKNHIKVIRRKDGILKIHSMILRHHTIDDMILASKTAKDSTDFNGKLYFSILVDADFEWTGGNQTEFENIQDIKNKYRNNERELFNLSSIYYYDLIYEKLHEYGLQPKNCICQKCKEEYKFYLPFVSFFGSALRPNLPGSKYGKRTA